MLNEWANISLNQEAGVCVCGGGGGEGGRVQREAGWNVNVEFGLSN